MKNWRNGVDDVGYPFVHKDPSPRLTKIGFGGLAVYIAYGPVMVPAPSSFVPQEPNQHGHTDRHK